MRELQIIVAVDEDGGYAKNKKIPWYFKEDFKHFKQKTENHICIMGLNTYKEIYQKIKKRHPNGNITNILKNRDTYVITKEKLLEGVTTFTTLDLALQNISETDNRSVFILGGERLFMEAFDNVTKIEMTIIKKKYNCDQFFPVDHTHNEFEIQTGTNNKDMYFVTYTRKKEI